MTDRLQIDALEDLAVQFRHLGRRPARRRLRHPSRRGVLALAAALTLAGTAAAGSGVLDFGDPLGGESPSAFSAEQRPLVEANRLAGVQVADPDGGPPMGTAALTHRRRRPVCHPGPRLGRQARHRSRWAIP